MLEVITGPMFSGKTEALIHQVKRAYHGGLAVQVFVPASDTRNGVGVIKSHGGLDLDVLGIGAWSVDETELQGLAQRVRPNTEVVAIDEAQFFSEELVRQVKTMTARPLRIYVAGLDLDYLQRPFGPMPHLLSLADRVKKLTAVCAGCREDSGRYSWRKTSDSERVVLGAADKYEPLCALCYHSKNQMRAREGVVVVT